MINLSTSLLLAAGLVVATTRPGLLSPPAETSTSYTRELFTPNLSSGFIPELPPVYFCGESVPLHEEIVARRLVSALARNTSQNRAIHQIRKRATAFFPIIEPILARHHIPLDFKYLPLVESALTGGAVSPKGAVGYWQFMPATARELGLSITPGHDERQNLVKSTNAACRYLRYLHNQLGSWTLAAAAYNNGIGALLGNIRRQRQHNYYYLRLNAETGKYLYRILAFKELFSNYRSYEHIIPDKMMAYLSEPLVPEPGPDADEVILSEVIVDEATKTAVDTPIDEVASVSTTRASDIALPNAADVFRGGIKARLVEASGMQRGQIWIFHLTRSGLADNREVDEGDVLYAVVEDIDSKTERIYLRADKLYSATEKHTYNLALSAIDASTGRLGIKMPDMAQVKAGWILTWKTL